MIRENQPAARPPERLAANRGLLGTRVPGPCRALTEQTLVDRQHDDSSSRLLTEAERHRILVGWNKTEADCPRNKCIYDLFECQVERTPDAAAVICGRERITYRELNERAVLLAGHLRGLAVRPDALVGICLERTIEMIAAILGVLKAGGAYLPLDPTYPKERLVFMLEDSHAPVIVTRTKLLATLPPRNAAVICLDDLSHASRYSHQPSIPNPQPSTSLAYVLYTSGSTGRPKGVAIEHRSVVTLIAWAHQVYRPEELRGVLASTSLCFDLSVFELFVPLTSGGTVILAENALALPSLPAAGEVTLINTVPSAIAELLRLDAIPDSVRTVNLAGEPLSQALVEQLYRKPTIERVFDLYGPTEDTVYSTCALRRPGGSATIGRPIANEQVYILDSHLQPTPIGIPGELFIGGDGLARGYLNRPELTAEKFIPNPFATVQSGKASSPDTLFASSNRIFCEPVPNHSDRSPSPGRDQGWVARSNPSTSERLYRTGDRARFLPDGNIEFLGRLDHQVKLRGYRIELGEIESVLRQHPSVNEAVVTAREGAPGEKRLAAYYCPAQWPPSDDDSLIDFLKARLPGYMIPSACVPLQSFPRTPNGKIDRAALPDPGAAKAEPEEGFVPPGTALEEALANIWRDVLGLKSVGIHDNFFKLGGHSLTAVRLLAQIESLAGRRISLMTLFHSPTIAQLAEILRRKETSTGPSSLMAIQASGSRPPLYLVHGTGGGMIWGYANLATYLDAGQPVYAFNSRGLAGLEEYPRIEEIAAQYVEALCAFQPRGPYHLGGYCFGGEVAFEMARQLMAQGRRVALLALLNAMPPNSGYEKVALTPRFWIRFLVNSCLWFDHFRQWTPGQQRDFGRRKLRVLKKKLNRMLHHSTPAVSTNAAEDLIDLSPYPEYQQKLWDIHIRASRRYVPKPYPGHITVFRTRVHPFICSFDPAFGWREFAGDGVTVRIVPGRHESILEEPHVQVLARELSACLENSQLNGDKVNTR